MAELCEQDFTASDTSAREVGAIERDHGLRIFLFQPFRDFEGLPEPLRARAERKFDLMAAVGTDLLIVPSTQHPLTLAGLDRAADDLHELGECIFQVQLAAAPRVAMDLRTLACHFRLMPGEGDLDVTGFTRAVLATGYGGRLSLEVINDQLRAGLPRLVALDGQRALLHLLEQVCRTEPALAAGLAAIPPAAPVQAVEFIEFATSPDEAPALVARLGVSRILYDQNDTGGSFFQRYSLSRPDGLFFEVVERRRGYGGYGAANAPYRIAARKRFARPAGMPRL